MDDRQKRKEQKPENVTPNFTKPVWGDIAMSCHSCNYNGQDIDTFPCAKCHTRH
ncbi:MAG: hypothetical protein OET90_02760 [Desulfuromonadales bacterium]|nr:hypothetical protein [Desulfuromonadales bacterium]